MKLVKNILTKNPCYTCGDKITVKGLMLHSVGCPQPSATVFINSWNNPNFGSACVHGFIDANDGTAYQTLPWDHRGWHGASGSKGCCNDTHIGVEMCEPACISYSGIQVNCHDMATAKAAVTRTYNTAVELFAMLCEKFKLDPLASGVVISHKEGCALGIASNHGDPEHLWNALETGYTMDGFRRDVKIKMGNSTTTVTKEDASNYTKIIGNSVATVDQMTAYIKKVNPEVPKSVIDMIPLYLSEGKIEGVRGDIAFAQSCLETGNFKFAGSAVTLDQNNFCGLGVTSNGMKGNSFETPQLGIRAQIQHLKAYASTESLKNECVDVRFKYVKRGSAPYVEWLGIQENPEKLGWAAGSDYGYKILIILKKISGMSSSVAKEEVQNSTVIKEEKQDSFIVRVNIPNLNIRKGPGTNFNTIGKYTGIGSFTIVETQKGAGSDNGWGKLKSGAGWISLDFAEKIK